MILSPSLLLYPCWYECLNVSVNVCVFGKLITYLPLSFYTPAICIYTIYIPDGGAVILHVVFYKIKIMQCPALHVCYHTCIHSLIWPLFLPCKTSWDRLDFHPQHWCEASILPLYYGEVIIYWWVVSINTWMFHIKIEIYVNTIVSISINKYDLYLKKNY